MTAQVFSLEAMRARGRTAFAEGKCRDDHDMNWHAAAIKDWQAGWDQAHYESKRREVATA